MVKKPVPLDLGVIYIIFTAVNQITHIYLIYEKVLNARGHCCRNAHTGVL